MTTIMEALQNAHYNICEGQAGMNLIIGKQQLNNAVTLLNKGYPLNFEVDDLLDEYEDVEKVPDFNKS